MGRTLQFKAGSFYRVDDRTGFPTRAERTRKEWNGFIVDEKRWEARQPQDLVKGTPDYQTVPEPRPLAPNSFVGPTFVKLNASVGPGATVLNVASFVGLGVGVPISVMMDDGVNFNTSVTALANGGNVTIAAPLPGFADQGNLVTINTENIPNPPLGL